MQFDWPYLTLRPDGVLVYADTQVQFETGAPHHFANTAQAEAWLVAEDRRGTVHGRVAP